MSASSRRSREQVLTDLGQQSSTPKQFGLSHFRRHGSVTDTTGSGDEETLLEFEADVPVDVREGDPFRVGLPAHETFVDDGNANTQTLALSHDVLDAPVTDPVVAYEGGVATTTSVDIDANEIDVATSGNGNTIDVYYIAADPAIIRVRKDTPTTRTQATSTLFDDPLNLIHAAPQFKSPETFDFSYLTEGTLADSFALRVTVEAPYRVALEPKTRANGTVTPSNAILSIPVEQGTSQVPGLGRILTLDMLDA